MERHKLTKVQMGSLRDLMVLDEDGGLYQSVEKSQGRA